MTQISFPLDQAHEALDQFLADEKREPKGHRWARNVLDAQGKECVAVIMDPAEHRELLDAWHAWNDSQQPQDAADLPPGYRPYLHSPEATPDRLLPHEPLHTPLAHALYRKKFDELEQREQDRIIGIAISCLLRTTFDADSQGAVPILMLGHAMDDPQPRQFWQLAYKTDIDGLFLRATANGFFGETWAIVTGSGWKLATGWLTREEAGCAAAAIARVLPYIDWMSMGPEVLTAKSKKALAAVLRRYHPFGVRDDEPEPEPLTEAAAAVG